MKIHKIRIIGTSTVVYSAWEPSSVMGPHSTITTFDGSWFGRVGTRTFREDEFQQAYGAILSEYPGLALVPHKKDMGEIVTV